MTVTIATDDAEQIVAEGGMVTLPQRRPFWCPRSQRWVSGDHTCTRATKHRPQDIVQISSNEGEWVGEARVRNVHPRRNCQDPDENDFHWVLDPMVKP